MKARLILQRLGISLFHESDRNDVTFQFADLNITGIRPARLELESASAAVGDYRREVTAEGYDGNELERLLQRILDAEADR
jgi:hypothetical protein